MAASPPTYRVFRDQHGIPQFEPKRGTQVLKDALIYTFPSLETELQLMQAALRKFFDSERGTQFVCELPENNLQASLAKKRDVPVSPVQATKASLRSWKTPGVQCTPSQPSSRASSRASSRGRSRASSRTPSRAENPRAENAAPNLEPLVEIRSGGIMTTWNLSNGQELEKRKRQPYDPIKRRKVAENRGNACDKHRASKTTCDPDECPQNKIHAKSTDGSPKEVRTLRGRASQASLPRPKPVTKASICDTDDGKIARTGTDGIPFDATHAEYVPIPAAPEVFWDAFEQDALALHAKHSVSSFGDLASNNDSGYWTDSDQVGAIPWNSYSHYPAFPEPLEGNLFSPGLDTGDNIEAFTGLKAHTIASNIVDSKLRNSSIADAQGLQFPLHQESPALSDETPDQTYTALPLDDPAQIPSQPSPGHSEEALMCSDDPFMGWASKKANHLFDDYGWVLSHVENL